MRAASITGWLEAPARNRILWELVPDGEGAHERCDGEKVF